jgi:hypothetical protein
MVVEIGEWLRTLARYYENKVYGKWWCLLLKKKT